MTDLQLNRVQLTTDEERLLGSEYERELLVQILLMELPRPTLQYRLAAIHVGLGPGVRTRLEQSGLRDWRFDFAWPDLKVAVEVDGGIWSRGRHVRGSGYADGCRKKNFATSLGWSVFTFTPSMIENGEAISLLVKVVREKQSGT